MSLEEAVEVFPAPEPDYAPPPGETLRELLDELGMSQAELARRAGLSPKHVNQLAQGIVPLSAEVAEKLELVTGMPARLWNRLEADYQSIQARNKQRGAFTEAVGWLDDMPVKDLVQRKILPDVPKDRVSRVSQMFAFFGVASVDAWSEVYAKPCGSFRRANADTLPGAVATWLRLGELAARDIHTDPYDDTRLRGVLEEVRGLTRSAPHEFMPRLRKIFSSAGVALVIVPEIKGARSYGCTRWLVADKALIQLSCRYRSDDQFWFTLFHECAHLLLHGKREVWIEDGDLAGDGREAEANTFASDQLIPRRYAAHLTQLRSKSQVEAFAGSIGVSPGVVVGRLQHDKLWKPSHGNMLKRRFSAEDLQALE